MQEIWKPISGYEGKYYISSYGRLMNKSGLIMKPMKCTNGYLSACLWKENKQQKILMHKLVACAFLDNPYRLSEINHLDENKENNRVENLEWCTHLYNMNYGSVKSKISAASLDRKLTPEQKLKCRSALGKRWLNNVFSEVLVNKEEIPLFISKGYRLGRKKLCMNE